VPILGEAYQNKLYSKRIRIRETYILNGVEFIPKKVKKITKKAA
jgi:hypothetical protein